jgi:hypothetical protein
MSAQRTTQQMGPPAENFHQSASCYLPSTSQSISEGASSISTNLYLSTRLNSKTGPATYLSAVSGNRDLREIQQVPHLSQTTMMNGTNSRFIASLNLSSKPTTASPARYKPHLTPKPSSLRPHCLVGDRPRLWRPASSTLSRMTGRDLNLGLAMTDMELVRIEEIMSAAWAYSATAGV